MQFKTNIFSTVLFIFGCSLVISAQELKFPELDKSPMDAAYYPSESAYKNYLDANDPDRNQKIKVLYCRPSLKGREILGVIEPYGKDWRMGANEATEVTFYQDVEIAGTTIASGTYTMFAEIYPTQWIFKISTERFIGGVDNRDTKQDILSVAVPTTTLMNPRETLTIGFQKVSESKVDMIVEWERTRAKLPINLNAPVLAELDNSPMDLVQYPNMSRLRNFVKPEELAANEPKVRVVYSRPQMKGRKIFGELLKVGEVWRAGANETTEITLFKEATIGGVKLRPGKYGLFVKLNATTWDFIIHKNVQSWGNANHNDKDNVVTVPVKPESTPTIVENMTILLNDNAKGQLELILAWENTMARLPISMK